MRQLGRKDDAEKPRWSLLPQGVMSQILLVLAHGATKYAENNWQAVPNASQRYYDAAMRHLTSWWDGERRDAESQLPHLAHAAVNVLFLMWFDAHPQLPADPGPDEDTPAFGWRGEEK